MNDDMKEVVGRVYDDIWRNGGGGVSYDDVERILERALPIVATKKQLEAIVAMMGVFQSVRAALAPAAKLGDVRVAIIDPHADSGVAGSAVLDRHGRVGEDERGVDDG